MTLHRGFQDLAHELKALFGRGVQQTLSDVAFNDLALRVFRYQLRTNEVYRRFALSRGLDGDSVRHWSVIPAVPAEAFKHVPWRSGPVTPRSLVFRTSGTTEGQGRRGEHHVPDPDIYRASLLPNFEAHLLPDGERLPVLSLIPPVDSAPDSSLSHMIGIVIDELGKGRSEWLVDPNAGLDGKRWRDACERARATKEPVLIVSTAFALVHMLDAAARDGWTIRLPEGSRVMETGGFKGKSRSVAREELYREVTRRLGVPDAGIVNEYGMTELLSQFYDGPVFTTTAGGVSGSGPERPSERPPHRAPPWVRTRVLDPSSLEPVSPGRPGVLCHYDLANVGSCMALLTADAGIEVDGGVRLQGRVEGSESRGCSIAMDELLEAAHG